MEKQPQFIREFSKEESADERQQLAHDISAKRAEHFAGKSEKTERQDELDTTATERERVLAEKLRTISELEKKIDELSTFGMAKVMNYFEIRKLRTDINVDQETSEELRAQQMTEITEKQTISDTLKSEMQVPRTMLADFYNKQKEKWADSEYTKEDIAKYFSEEHLASLSIEGYATLLKRFPGEMVTHVTRQGIRDHTGHLGHTAGAGVYSDGFMKIVEDGRLRSPLSICLVEEEKEKAIARFLRLDLFKSQSVPKENALGYLDEITHRIQGRPGSGDYADRTAVHFATEEVADCFYGSEAGNEIFVAYPSAYIASQYYFHGQLNQVDKNGPHDAWNDQWVWANEEKGMDLNAGIIFIPAEVRVDKRNGSRYELDGNLNRIKNKEYCVTLRKLTDSVNFDDLEKQTSELTKGIRYYGSPGDYKIEFMKSIEPLCQKLEQEFSTISRDLFLIFFHKLDTFHYVAKIEREGNNPGYVSSIDGYIEKELEEAGLLYLRAKDTVSSEEFWEKYFKKNISKRPSKIVYYGESNPTSALFGWRYRNGIDKKSTDENIGFSDNNIGPDDMAKVTAGMDRFKTLAQKVIEDYFTQNSAA